MATKKLTAAKEGKSSLFRIVVSDAKHENFEYNTMEVTGSEIITVKVTVTQEKGASISYYRDNTLWDTDTATYQNYLDQKNKPSVAPSASPSNTPTSSPTATPKATPSGSAKTSPTPSGG
ncbi:hypothetical protein D3C71_1557910 [compost metagenome]